MAHVGVALRVLACAAIASGVGCVKTAHAPPSAPKPAPVAAAEPLQPPLGVLPDGVRPLAYTLELEIVPAGERFGGRVQIAVQLDVPTANVWLHGRGLDVQRAQATVNGRAIAASWSPMSEDGLALLRFAERLPAGQTVIEIVYDAAFDKRLEGLYRVEVGEDAYAFTQLEPIAARSVFPCFDQPSFKTPFDIWITAPVGQTVISNNPVAGLEPIDAARQRVHFEPTPPMPTYLVALAVGPLDVVEAAPLPPNEVRTRPLPFRGVAARGAGPKLAYALANTGPLLDAMERYTGLEYPYAKLDIIAVPDFGPGAMENVGAITFREWLLLLDGDEAPEHQRRAFAHVMAHELAHMWFGDLVTMPWWDDIWLNEAFATWLAQRVIHEVHPSHRADMGFVSSVQGAMQEDSRLSARMVRQPIASSHDIANAFDAITYRKGAGLLAMFERYLGEEKFRAGLRRYLRAHAHATASATELVSAVSEAAGSDLSAAFYSFLQQPGVPLLDTEIQCDDAGARLELTQSRFLPVGSTGDRALTWTLPVCARYAAGRAEHESCALLSDTAGVLPLEGCPRWLVPNAQSAGYYRYSLAAPDLKQLRERGWSRLSGREKLGVVDSLLAGFEGGRSSAATLLAALPTLVGEEERTIVAAPMALLSFMRERLLDAELRPKLERHAGKLYQPVLARLGWRDRPDDSGEDKLLRAEVVAFLAETARVPAVRKRAARLGRRYLGADGEPDAAELPAELRDVSARIAVEDGDEPLFDAVLARLKSTNEPGERYRLLVALGSVRDARSQRALALTLDPALRVNEALVPLQQQVGDERTREAAWAWLEANLDAVIERVSPRRAAGLAWLAEPFCSEAAAARLEALLRARVHQLTGGPRNLDGALEALRLCSARVALHRSSAERFFTELK